MRLVRLTSWDLLRSWFKSPVSKAATRRGQHLHGGGKGQGWVERLSELVIISPLFSTDFFLLPGHCPYTSSRISSANELNFPLTRVKKRKRQHKENKDRNNTYQNINVCDVTNFYMASTSQKRKIRKRYEKDKQKKPGDDIDSNIDSSIDNGNYYSLYNKLAIFLYKRLYNLSVP